MGLREDRNYLKERKAERDALEKNALAKAKEDSNNRTIRVEDARALREAAIDNFYDYKDNVKKTLLKTALMELYTGSFRNITDRERRICENLMEQYIGETGTPKLLKNMRLSKSYLLNIISEKVDEYSKKITADASAENPDTQIISSADVKDFWNQIDKAEDIEDITNLIRLRVSNAEEDFVNKNQEDKADINSILKNTATRIQMAKGSNDNDYGEAVEESETRIARQNIYKIQHESNHNVFDRMVRNLSEVAVSNPEAKKTFMENGHLNMDRIVESVRCMYTLLETVATIQLENVDADYIEDTIKSIK